MVFNPIKMWCLFYQRFHIQSQIHGARWHLQATPRLWSVLVILLVAVIWRGLPNFLHRSSSPRYGGHVHEAFREVEEVFRRNIHSGKEPGASFAVYRNGEIVVDLWGGDADADARRPWRQNTLSQAWSCTKGIVAVIMAMLIDRGLLDYNERVQTYWPEFGQNGKSNITVAMLLSHQAGLVSLGRQISLQDYRDKWEELERLMAEQKPAWPPGTKYGYHAHTFGMYADAVVRKVDPGHRNISQFFKEDIAEPFDLDFYIGLPLDQYYRSARGSYVSVWQIVVHRFLSRPSQWVWLPELIPGKTLHNSLTVFDFMNDMNVMNDPDYQAIGLSSAMGFGTARSLAKMYDYLANNGSIHGKQLLSARQVSRLSTPVTENLPVLAAPAHPYSMGMLVETNIMGQTIFGHRGYGGQDGFADPSYRMGVAYITNFNSKHSEDSDPRALDLLHALYKCLLKYNAS